MKKLISSIIKNPLISGSAMMFFGTLLGNFFNFMFNFYMSRNLSVIDYGTLSSLVSIILLCSLASESFVPTIVHFSGSFFAKNQHEKVIALFWYLNKYMYFIGGGFFIFFVMMRSQIGDFFKINEGFLVMMVGFIVLFSFAGALNRAILQAKLEFKYISFINISAAFSKLISGILLVLLGFQIFGAMWAFFISFFIAYLLSFLPLSFIFKKTQTSSEVTLKKFLDYGGPATMTLLGLTFFITIDIMLVKHFFPPEQAGIYAGLSLLGRIIYFFTAPITSVLFPLVVQKHTRQEKFHHLFILGITIVFVSSIGMVFFYYLLPEVLIKILLKKDEYLVIKPLLGIFGIYMLLYSMLFLVSNFFLAIKKIKVFIPILLAACAQSILIWMYHETFLQVIWISIISVGIPLGLLLSYHFISYDKRR